MLILVDSREQKPWKFKDYECHRCTLETGDYAMADETRPKYKDSDLNHLLCIDRKGATSELYQNVTQVRFKKEIERMKRFKHAYLILEFSVDDIMRFPVGSNIPRRRWRYLKVKPQYVMGYLTNLMLEGIQVIFAGNAANAQRIALSLMKKVYQEWEKENDTN